MFPFHEVLLAANFMSSQLQHSQEETLPNKNSHTFRGFSSFFSDVSLPESGQEYIQSFGPEELRQIRSLASAEAQGVMELQISVAWSVGTCHPVEHTFKPVCLLNNRVKI